MRALNGGKDTGRFACTEEDIARIREPEMRATLDTLRKPPLGNGERTLRATSRTSCRC